jgi:hypothetical protein
MNLKEIALEINETLEKRRKDLRLSFVESKHIYYMMDSDGKIKSNFPSVSKILKKLHQPFDADGISLRMAGGDPDRQKEILAEWRQLGDLSTNMGSRVHYNLEIDLIGQYGDYKKVREPIYNCDEESIRKSDNMIKAGKDYINLMHERGAVLLDTEIILGDPELRYVGQPDTGWIMETKDKSTFGLVITDWKSNQPKNFEVKPYNGNMYAPLNEFRDFALTHYQVQIPLYGRLLLKMLKGTKFENMKFLGGVIVLLKEDGTFIEYKCPPAVNNIVLNMELNKFVI